MKQVTIEDIDRVAEGLPYEFKRKILSIKLANTNNYQSLIDYLKDCRQNNLSSSYLRITINIIYYLNKFVNKEFKDITKDDLTTFLDSHRKSEPIDPLHKWIGTYNHYLILLSKFIKWLHYPDIPSRERPKPACITNLSTLKRKEKSIYKPTDMWTQQDDLLFLKYCPSKRDRCYHAMARDSSCRPSEILGLRIKDINFKMANDRQYAEVVVSGKTGQRHIPLISCLPYLKDWIDNHPLNIPNSYLICSLGNALGAKIVHESSLNNIYKSHKRYFESLLNNPEVSPEDKVKIKELLRKPWNPYIRRHSALTEKSQILKEHTLRQHAGWSMGSNMHLKYLHYFGNESNDSILEAYGLKPKSEEIDKMKPRQCPNCNELNKIDSKFCVKCRMVLSYDSYIETINKAQIDEAKMDKIQMLVDRIENLEKQLTK